MERITGLFGRENSVENETYIRAERQHVPSFLADPRPSTMQRTWEEGSWATGNKSQPEKKSSSLLVNLFLLVLVALMIPTAMSFLGYGNEINRFFGSEPISQSLHTAASATRVSPRAPRLRRRGELQSESRQRESAERLSESEAKVKLRMAQREMKEMNDRIKSLEKMSAKQHIPNSPEGIRGAMQQTNEQAAELAKAEKKIESLEETLNRLQEEEQRRLKRSAEQRKQIMVLEKQNENLERGVMDKDADRKEIETLLRRVSELSSDLASKRKSHVSGEAKRIHTAIQAHLSAEEDNVKHLTRQRVKLQAELEAAQKEAEEYKKQATAAEKASERATAHHARPRNTAPSPPPPPPPHRHHSHSVRWSFDDKNRNYADEVQKKERAEEKAISRKADQMLSRRDEELGLDAKHRKMLRNLEDQAATRDRKADSAAEHDLQAREKEIDEMMGSNSDCPGPDCMEPKSTKSSRALDAAAKWASSRYSSSNRN